MQLKMPSYFGWLMITIITALLLQSGCTPISTGASMNATPVGTPIVVNATQVAVTAMSTAEAPVVPSPDAVTPVMATVVPTDTVADATAPTADVWTTSTSPDQTWTATTVVTYSADNSQVYQALTVSNVDGSTIYTAVAGWDANGLGFPVAVPFAWSADSNILYYTNQVQPDGCAVFTLSTDLHRLDLTDGSQEELLPVIARSITLSPDEQQVAYVPLDANTIIIRDLTTGEERATSLTTGEDTAVGSLTWSPDGSLIAATVAHDLCIQIAESTSLYTVDTMTGEATAVLSEDDRLLIPYGWANTNTLVMGILGDPNSVRFTFDITTGELFTIRR